MAKVAGLKAWNSIKKRLFLKVTSSTKLFFVIKQRLMCM